ncbi:lipopolysaccharide kinase InaA family protein [Aestuariirhabdus sp. LZHN29]|uniref:lipopolysaccharide kinase InaA family protein n=1 Tax=Aestuariirhabdus sp. LZHN29 TaxID=3417462 RepID=UPI003CF81E8D
MISTFTSDSLRNTFDENKLGDFEALWNLELPWFEEPNKRRSGWSGVVRHSLAQSNGEPLNLFIKRQQNHNTPCLRHPIKGEPTFAREYRNIIKLQRLGVPTIDPVYYGERLHNGDSQSILISVALDHHQTVDELFPQVENPRPLIDAIASLASQLHSHRLAHYCFYPNHIFVAQDSPGVFKPRLIDLEKMRFVPLPHRRTLKDFHTFIRRAAFMGADNLNLLLQSYAEQSGCLRAGDKTYQRLQKHIERLNYSND